MPKPKISIVIMAAGESSRFGSPKQLQKWKNSNLLQHVIDIAFKSKAFDVSIVLGANYDAIINEIKTDSIKVLRNKSWKNGLGNSIAFGIKSVIKEKPRVEGVLLMLADQPLIEPNYLDTLIKKFETNKNQIIASTYSNKRFGVPVLFGRKYFEELMQLNDDEGAKKIIKKHEEVVYFLDSSQMFSDIDTLEAYKKLYGEHH